MGSWKPSDFRGRTFSVGDLVELRDEAENGFQIAYRVCCVDDDGALQLDNLSTNERLTVPAEDVHTSVFTARTAVSGGEV
ncbi:hypothetical protein ACT17_11960 [Mycolicibacterium conceptionense]|uniref:Uncharacterized protein n=1 Tax=Mycolicibacterium conceptionense TaxID=451644 RepID=A0A0J8WYU8_9MYCO|nr:MULTISPECIES: hypothetical protein [Mycobacteriaceae]KMV18334.1 hypothetical protein ACT17_11960 [Mycolicibacterium conceptionense]OBF76111.1 hypothetical protein A5751_24555 [Mycolicibacterium fortuitum]TMS51085.1 hypothetical protein E0T84_21255 [Mycobacterium sp. DBP42]